MKRDKDDRTYARTRPDRQVPSLEDQLARAQIAANVVKSNPTGSDRLAAAVAIPPAPKQAGALVGSQAVGMVSGIGAVPLGEEAYALRLSGYLPHEIAQHLSLTRTSKEGKVLSEADVVGLLREVADRRGLLTQTSLANEMMLDYQRIEMLIKALWADALEGDKNASDRIARLLQRKATMLGLDSPEVRVNLSANSDTDYSRLSLDELTALKSLLAKAGGPEPAIKDVIDLDSEPGVGVAKTRGKKPEV